MISYNPLWHTLIDKGMNKGDLMRETGISFGTMASMGKKRASQLKADRQDLQSSSLQDRGCYRI